MMQETEEQRIAAEIVGNVERCEWDLTENDGMKCEYRKDTGKISI